MPTISVKNVTKKYRLIKPGYNYLSLRDKIGRLFRTDNFSFGGKSENEFNALEDVSFEVQAGEILGIVGDNGSGKSTLLKIISRVTWPTKGEVAVRGKVASMLEVGTGFHPELTGRENIYLNGAILGMAQKEIDRNFEEIVDFSGVKEFLDIPVKHYSSGMQARLAFSVAIYIDSDILIVDEVLAVGDIEFQKKCLLKMGEIAGNNNKTILFVSHNLRSVQSLCGRCLLLNKGKIEMMGGSKEVVENYIKMKSGGNHIDLSANNFKSDDFELLSFRLDNGVNGRFCVHCGSPIIIKINIFAKKDIDFLSFVIGVETLDGSMIYNSWDVDYMKKKFSFEKNKTYEVVLSINHNLAVGTYNIAFSVLGGDYIYENYNQAVLEVIRGQDQPYPNRNGGIVNFDATWNKQEL